jgi:hypothetical protein
VFDRYLLNFNIIFDPGDGFFTNSTFDLGDDK